MKINRVNILIILSLLTGCSKKDNPIQSTPEQFTIIGGNLNTTLTISESPYKVAGNIIVDSSGTLNVEAGVRIYFEDSTQMIVRGRLAIIGNPAHQILLTSKNTSWKGIQITGTNIQSIIQFVIVENIDVTTPNDTSRDGAVEISNAGVVICNSIFRNNKANNGGALIIDRSQSRITNCLFINNYAVGFGGALISSSSSNTIVNNAFYKNSSNNYAGGLLLMSPLLDSIQNNIFYENSCRTGDPRISYFQTDSSHCVTGYNFLEVTVSPRFVSTADLHLSTLSPCINAGNPAPQFNDIDGTRNDQGAYGGPSGNW